MYVVKSKASPQLTAPHLTSPHPTSPQLQVATSGHNWYKWFDVVKSGVMWFYVAKELYVAKWFHVDKWFYVAKWFCVAK